MYIINRDGKVEGHRATDEMDYMAYFRMDGRVLKLYRRRYVTIPLQEGEWVLTTMDGEIVARGTTPSGA
jgi:hypothetical protein